MKTVSAIIFLILCGLLSTYSQGEIDDQEKIFYRNERTFAAIINTNGYGLGFRYAKRLDGFRKSTYELGLFYVKDEAETKISLSSTQQVGTSFVFGKINAFYTLHTGIGYQRELFQKRDRGGISIRYFYNFGPSIGILKPIYYLYYVDSVKSNIPKKFELDAITNIEGKAPFFKGMNEIFIIPGAYGKFGFTFEFSKADQIFSAIETGAELNLFVKKVPIMANNTNQFAFFSLFLSYRFGKVIDAKFDSGPNKIDALINKQ
jgi:hypothetical protein